MALGDNTTSAERGVGARGRQPYLISRQTLILRLLQATRVLPLLPHDVIPGLTIPANTLIMCAGFEVTKHMLVLQRPTQILTSVLLAVTWITLLMVSTLTVHL